MIMDTARTGVEKKVDDQSKSDRCGKRNFDIAFLTDQDSLPASPTKTKKTTDFDDHKGQSAFTKVVKETSVTTPQASFSPPEKPDMSFYLRNISSLWLQPQEPFVPFLNQSQLLNMSRPYQGLLGLQQATPALPFIRPKLKEEEDPLSIVDSLHPTMLPTLPPMVQPVFTPSLMSPALAALTMTTNQNVCAKCNLSFRMTSDLVYHMRSQHRPDGDQDKVKRGEKLKCSVCGESFRERHHLTRHMTSHTDKDRSHPSGP